MSALFRIQMGLGWALFPKVQLQQEVARSLAAIWASALAAAHCSLVPLCSALSVGLVLLVFTSVPGNGSGWKTAFLKIFGFIFSLPTRYLSDWFQTAQVAQRRQGGGLQFRGTRGWKGRTADMKPTLLPSTHSNNDSEPRLIQARLTYWIPPKGDNSPSVQMQGPRSLEQKKVYSFLSLAKYFWAATVLILLTGLKETLLSR